KAAFGAFYNQGEVCSATSRIFVERPVFDEFVHLLTRAAESFQPGDPLDPDTAIGSLVSEKHADEVWECVEQARADGTIVAGGERPAIN
ncbi:aldehyde dehydrogenase PuuC, partial [Burkholderia multivorans]